MNNSAALLRDARQRAGVTQAELARRLGVSQAAVAKLERPAANSRVTTLDAALGALGQRLVLTAKPRRNIDETLVVEQLKLTPERRLVQLEDMYEWSRDLALAGRWARGERDLADVESLETAQESPGRSRP